LVSKENFDDPAILRFQRLSAAIRQLSKSPSLENGVSRRRPPSTAFATKEPTEAKPLFAASGEGTGTHWPAVATFTGRHVPAHRCLGDTVEVVVLEGLGQALVGIDAAHDTAEHVVGIGVDDAAFAGQDLGQPAGLGIVALLGGDAVAGVCWVRCNSASRAFAVQ